MYKGTVLFHFVYKWINQLKCNQMSLKTSLSLSQSGTTALFFAAQQGHNDIVRFLFEFGASTECRTKVRELSHFLPC